MGNHRILNRLACFKGIRSALGKKKNEVNELKSTSDSITSKSHGTVLSKDDHVSKENTESRSAGAYEYLQSSSVSENLVQGIKEGIEIINDIENNQVNSTDKIFEPKSCDNITIELDSSRYTDLHCSSVTQIVSNITKLDDVSENTLMNSYSSLALEEPNKLKQRSRKRRVSTSGRKIDPHREKLRARKKYILTSLTQSENFLKEENQSLKKMLRENLPSDVAEKMIRQSGKASKRLSLKELEDDLSKSRSKRIMIENLQKSVAMLRKENSKLKAAILVFVGDEALDNQINNKSSTWYIPNSSADVDTKFLIELQEADQNFCVTDPTLQDNPIVFATPGFLELTGYKLDQILGRNCRFLQGAETDPNDISKIRDAITAGVDISLCILNYKADGTSFWNLFHLAVLRDEEGKIINFIGIQCEVSASYAAKTRKALEQGNDVDLNQSFMSIDLDASHHNLLAPSAA